MSMLIHIAQYLQGVDDYDDTDDDLDLEDDEDETCIICGEYWQECICDEEDDDD